MVKKKTKKSKPTYEYLVAKGKEYSENLRKNATIWEIKFFKSLSDLHYKFKFQFPVVLPIGKKSHKLYILDFLLTDYNLVVEIDGKFHGKKQNKRLDNLRTKRLEKSGYHVIRLFNSQISVLTIKQIDDLIKHTINVKNLNNS